MKNKIVVIGSSNVDLIMKMDHLPEKGETVTDAEFFQVYGGKGANQAVAAARAGGNVACVSCVGEDAYTPQMVQNYKNDGIDTRFVSEEVGVASGHALIMIGSDGDNCISVAPEAMYAMSGKVNLQTEKRRWGNVGRIFASVEKSGGYLDFGGTGAGFAPARAGGAGIAAISETISTAF